MSMIDSSKVKGFSAIEGVIILLIVALLGISGWYVWQRNRQDTNLVSTTATQATASKRSEMGHVRQ